MKETTSEQSNSIEMVSTKAIDNGQALGLNSQQPTAIVDTPISAEVEQKRVIGKPFTGADDPRRWKEGRPDGAKGFNTLFEEALKKIAKVNGKEPEDFDVEILAKAIEKARKGDFRFFKDLFDRRFGKPKESIDHTSGGEKLNNKIEWVIIDGEKDGTENE